MVRLATRVLLLFVAAFALACTDTPTATAPQLTPGEEMTLVQAESDIYWTRGCPTIGPIGVLAALLFASDRNDRAWISERLSGLSDDVRSRRRDRIQARAHAIVEWLLARQRAGKFRGTDAQLAALINAIYCFAGIDLSIETPKNTELILPADQPQTVKTTDGQAGVQLEANPVTEPTLLTITQLPPGTTGLLDTKLDQYPGFLMITAQSEGNAPLAKPVVVGVCASGVIPQAVRDRLRLGHGKSTGFEIAQPANADFLSCPNQVADAGTAPLWQRLANAMLPQQLHAYQEFSGGGVGGTVTEFSPFAPVDPELSFGGGVGGTVTEFIRVPMPGMPKPKSKTPLTPSIVADPCEFGPPGQPLSASCVPSVRITTRLGTELANVPVTWDVIAGGGSVAPKSSVCGAFGSTAATQTNASGRAGICWTLGAPGSNKVRATPGVGGDAPEGVSFTPTQSEFEVTATSGAPFALRIVQGDPQFDLTPFAAVPIPPTVRLTDELGYPISGAKITWYPWPSSIGGGGSVASLETYTDADGVSSNTWIIGDGYNHMWAYVLVGEMKLLVDFRALTDH